MAINEDEKRILIQKFREAIRKGDDLELELLFKGEKDEAEKIRKETDKLIARNKALIAALMEEWLGTAAEIEGKMEIVNTGLEAVLQYIKDDIEIAKNVVKALGYLDDAIGIAVKLLKYA